MGLLLTGAGGQGGAASDPNLYFFLVVGQSNGTGNGGALVPFNGTATNSTALTTTPQDFGYCLAPGTVPLNNNDSAPSFPDASLTPLSGIFCGGDTWSNVIHGENLGPALCQYLHGKHATRNYAVAIAGYDGYSVGQIEKGQNPYSNSILYIKELNQQAPILNTGGVAICLGVVYVGGEEDAVVGSPVCTVASGSNGVTLPLVDITISTSAFTTGSGTNVDYPATNGAIIMQSTVGPQYITYTSATSGTFSGCNGGTATGACGLSDGQLQTGHQIYNANYTTLLKAMAANYVTDIQAITGQSLTNYPIPMYFRQQTGYASGYAASGGQAGRTAWQDYCILRDDILGGGVRKFWSFGAAYATPGVSPVAAGLHYNNAGQRWQGEMLGKVIDNVVYGAGNWDNPRPTGISRTGAVITLTVQTPFGQGYFNARTIKAYYTSTGNPTWGFSYQDSSGAIAVNSVSVTATASAMTFTITLASDPTANTTRLLRAGWIGESATNQMSRISGARTNCFAASSAVSNYGYSLDDPMLIFEEGVP